MKKFKELTVYKPNQLIEIEGVEIEGGYISTGSFLAYNYILHKLQKNGVNNIIISGADFFNSLELSKHYDDLISYFDELRKISVVSRDSKGKLWGAFNLISAFERLSDGTFYLEIPNLIFNSLCKGDNFYYTTIKLLEQKSFKCSYTIIFYEIFKKYEKVNIPIYTIEELKALTSTQNKYLEYKYFKRDVIEKSLREINSSDNELEYYYEEERLGRKINKIRFLKRPKYDHIEIDKIEFSPALKNAIKTARKNRFIDIAYSSKAIKELYKRYNEEDIIKALKEAYKYNSEIFSFSKFMTAKINDIINSKNEKKETKRVSKTSIKETISPIIFDDSIVNEEVIEISKEDYEKLYEIYLEKNKVPHMKSVRIGFDRMNKTKFKIID